MEEGKAKGMMMMMMLTFLKPIRDVHAESLDQSKVRQEASNKSDKGEEHQN